VVVQSPSYWERIVRNRALGGIHKHYWFFFFLSIFFVVKSIVVEHFDSLMKEAYILKKFIKCPEIVHGLGFEVTFEHGLLLYYLFMEYALERTPEDLMKKSGGKLVKHDVQKYIRMIIKGLCCIHEKGSFQFNAIQLS
jgi:serine/threonine protein kinase